jgi:hypothetical protein
LPYKKFGAQTALSSLRFMRLPKWTEVVPDAEAGSRSALFA